MAQRQLTRSRSDRLLAGVCGGLANFFGVSSGVVRVLVVASCLLPGPQFLIYLAAWLFLPVED